MSKQKPLWEQAREKYAQELLKHPKDKMTFEASFDPKATPEEFSNAIAAAQKKRLDSKTSRALDRLDMLFSPLQQIAPFFDVMAQMNATIGAAIWGPLKLVLILLKTRSDALEMLADVLQFLVTNTQRYLAYERLHGDDGKVQMVLGDFYFDMIDFCVRAVRYFSKNAFKQMCKGMFKPFDGDFKDVIKSMKLHATAVDMSSMAAEMEKAATERDLQEQFRRLSKTEFKKNEQERQEAKKERSEAVVERAEQEKFRQEYVIKQVNEKEGEVRRWLCPGDYSKREHDRRRKDRVEGTCDWLLELDSVKSWMAAGVQSPRLLWVYGKPGSGKSMIASAIVSELMKSSKNLLYFFYNGKGSAGTHTSALAFVKVCLFGMLDIFPGAVDIVYAEIQSSGNPTASSFEALWELFENCLEQTQEPAFCLIDAMDECAESKELMSRVVNLTSRQKNMHMCVVSRPLEQIRAEIASVAKDGSCPLAEVSVATEEVGSDITRYLQTRIGKSPGLLEAGIQNHVPELTERAGGMFLWARLMLDELEKSKTLKEMREKVTSTPDDLDDMYKSIFQRLFEMKQGDRRLLHKILTWILTSESSLTVEELTVALAIRHEEQDINKENFLRKPRDYILSVSSPLVEILPDNTVRTVHATVKEYCMEDHEWPPDFDFHEARMNIFLARETLALLSYESYSAESLMCWNNPGCSQSMPILFSYAADNWWVHCQRALGRQAIDTADYESLRQDMLRFIQSEKSVVWFYYFVVTKEGASKYKSVHWVLQTLAGSEVRHFDEIFLNLANRVVEYNKRVYGEEHIATLWSLHGPLHILIRQHRLAEAEKLAENIVNTALETVGEENDMTIRSIECLMTIVFEQGRGKELEKWAVRVLNVQKKRLGDEHHHTLHAMENLATAYNLQDRSEEAQELEEKALAVRRSRYGERTLGTLRAIENLALTYSRRNRYDQAAELQASALEGWKALLGEGHPDTVKSIVNLASTYSDEGKNAEAEELEAKALAAYKKIYDPDHPRVLWVMRNLAITYARQKKYTDAVKMLGQVIELRSRSNNGEHDEDDDGDKALLQRWRNKIQPEDDSVSLDSGIETDESED